MHTYRNCALLIDRIDKEYKFEILDTERKEDNAKMNGRQESVQGTHMSVKLKRWEDAADAALSTNKQWSFMTKLTTDIQNGNDAIFSGAAHAMDITQTCSVGAGVPAWGGRAASRC